MQGDICPLCGRSTNRSLLLIHRKRSSFSHKRRPLEILGVNALSFELLEGFYNYGLILFIGYAVPLILVVENERICLAFLDEVGNENGEKVLALLGVLRKISIEELGETSLSFSKVSGSEAPEVHGYDSIGIERLLVALVEEVDGTVCLYADLSALNDLGKKAVLEGAYASCNGALLCYGVLKKVADHSEVILLVVLGVLKELVDLLESVCAVVVVSVDNCEGALNGIKAAHKSVCGAPGLSSALGNGITLGKLVELLENVLNVDVLALEVLIHYLAEVLLDLLLDNEGDVTEAGSDRIVDGIVDDDVTLLVD